jgi:hypothetical protein
VCDPTGFFCSAVHYPLVIDRALEDLQRSRPGEVHLSPEAQGVLYAHGSRHKVKFERLLKDQKKKNLEELAQGLSERLEEALKRSKQTDDQGRPYNPPRIDGEALKEVLKENPWLPDAAHGGTLVR